MIVGMAKDRLKWTPNMLNEEIGVHIKNYFLECEVFTVKTKGQNFTFALLKRSLIRAEPTPTRTSTNSEPAIW